jgi:hypothetical protein
LTWPGWPKILGSTVNWTNDLGLTRKQTRNKNKAKNRLKIKTLKKTQKRSWKKLIKCKKNKEHEEHSNPNSSNMKSNLDHISRNKKHENDGSQSYKL